MQVETQIEINSSKEKIWEVISDIENSVKTITAIEKIEILEKPESGLLGLKWKESRTMFGKTADETMWITKAEENKYYETRAENHGMVYNSWLKISENSSACTLTMAFSAEAQTLGAKISGFIFSPMMKGAVKKGFQADLEDIKKVCEA